MCQSLSAGLWAGFSLAPTLPTPPLGSQMGLEEDEDESGLWDQSVQGCFSCARASSVLTLGLRWGGRARTLPRGWNEGLGGGHRVPGSAGLRLEITLVVETAARGFSRRRRREASRGGTGVLG